jgi:RNA polymerase sigma-70 factor (family 1)
MNSQAIHYSAFEQVFKKSYAALCRHAYNFLRDKDACEDLVQDLFIKLWEDRPELFSDKIIVSYLYTATKNNCISILRKKVYVVSVEDESIDDIPDNEQREQNEETEQLYNRIFEAIENLPPKCALTFKMHRLGGMSYKQIADELGVSVKTVENQIGKALKVLRQTTSTSMTQIVFILLFLESIINSLV